MNWFPPERLLLLAGAAALLWMVLEYRQHGRRAGLAVLTGVCSGLAALLAVYWFGGRLGWVLPLNAGTAAVAAVLGISGVLLLLLMQHLTAS